MKVLLPVSVVHTAESGAFVSNDFHVSIAAVSSLVIGTEVASLASSARSDVAPAKIAKKLAI